jgi:adenylylsulfate kinase-like enzyme
MIIVLFGQPHCGKTTLARKLVGDQSWNIDGDELRELFKNKNFTREGRIQNLNRASDIAHYMNSLGSDIILSLIYPYKEARDYLNSLTDNVRWIYLTYEGERGRESYHVKDFEVPGDDEKVLHLNTTELTPDECSSLIEKYLYDN